MAGYSLAAREARALAVTNMGAWISLHYNDPLTTGVSEVAGGTYERVETTWDAGATDGSVLGTEVFFDVSSGTYRFAGIWTQQINGLYLGGGALSTGDVVLNGPGQVRTIPTCTG